MTPPEHEHEYAEHPSVREAVVVSVVRVVSLRGQGCCELSTKRLVTSYYSLDGELLAEDDPAESRP